MAELDFDELDKAVNDLMANVDTSKRPAGLDDPEDTVVTIPSSDTPEPAASPAEPATTAIEPSTPTPSADVASPSLAMKRRGQFMDIVHPSRDMTANVRPTGRQGVTIQPDVAIDSSATNETPTPESISEPPVVADEVVVTSDAAPSQSEWPDPIDLAAEPKEPSTVGTGPVEEVVAPESAQPQADQAADETPPLSSPFLADAKVEKRPLGGAPQSAEDIAVSDTQVAPAEVAPSIVLPEELAGDVMAVEAKDLSGHPAAAKPQPTEVKTSSIGSKATEAAANSIAQQYTEQPSSGDQTNGSIYDTATYHQAIGTEKSAKKPSSLKWIIWIIVLLLVGAAGGAAYFYFTR